MARDTYRRIQKYEGKLDPEIVKKRFEVQKPAMVEQETSIFADLVSIEEAAKTVLDAEGVPISLYPMYLFPIQGRYGGCRRITVGMSYMTRCELRRRSGYPVLFRLRSWNDCGLTSSELHYHRLHNEGNEGGKKLPPSFSLSSVKKLRQGVFRVIGKIENQVFSDISFYASGGCGVWRGNIDLG